MAVIKETKKYLHMLVKILVFVLVLCILKLIESFFEVKNLGLVYRASYFVFTYFIIGRLFNTPKEKLMVLLYLIIDQVSMERYHMSIKYGVIFLIINTALILTYFFLNKNEGKKDFMIFLIPCYLTAVKIITVFVYIYLHIDDYNFGFSWLF